MHMSNIFIPLSFISLLFTFTVDTYIYTNNTVYNSIQLVYRFLSRLSNENIFILNLTEFPFILMLPSYPNGMQTSFQGSEGRLEILVLVKK